MLRIHRRSFLAAGALALAGCRAPWRRAPAVAAKPPPLPVVITPPLSAAQAAALEAFDPKVTVITAGAAADLIAPGRTPWAVVQSEGAPDPNRNVPLDAIFATTNFDPASLFASARSAFEVDGALYAVPISAAPTGLLYRPDAFADSGLAVPAADWTLADFLTCAGVITARIRSGALPKYRAALSNELGGHVSTDASGRAQVAYGHALSDHLWSAMVLGYGGPIVQDGRYSLTDAATIEALAQLVQISAEYSLPPPAGPLSPAASQAYEAGAAMRFQQYWPTFQAAGWRWARMPVMPVAGVVPVQEEGTMLSGLVAHSAPDGSASVAYGATDVQAPDAALEAVVEYALWQYQRARTDPADPTVPPPVLADPAVQSAYWGTPARIADGSVNLGAYRDYRVMIQSWPVAGNSLQETADFQVYQALTDVATKGANLAQALAAAEEQLNAGVARMNASTVRLP